MKVFQMPFGLMTSYVQNITLWCIASIPCGPEHGTMEEACNVVHYIAIAVSRNLQFD